MSKKDRFPSQQLDQYMLRFPDGMRDELKKLAAENGRSLNAEIIQRLERTLTADVFNKQVPADTAAKRAGGNKEDEAILRDKLEDAIFKSGIADVLAEFVLQKRHKEDSEASDD
jgi:plasmid stability protein